MIDFEPYRRKEATIQQLAERLTRDGLAWSTNEMCDHQLQLLAGVQDEDVTYVPIDPEANDTFADDPALVDLAWTLGHVVVHTTASSEESAALALTLARGLPVVERSRNEVPWPDATTVAFLVSRIQESRRMRLAMLEAWPDQPHLENFYRTADDRPPINALGRFVSGLLHDDSHVAQIETVAAQARVAANASVP